ncbi:MAG: hypothetical protein JNM84_28360 [Planctomycetes bacterium]|nr:hypothetical protein [Planctomycetota bacterium]
MALPLLSGICSSVGYAQLTFFVNAESGVDVTTRNGLTPGTAWQSLRFTFAQIVLPAPGTFHTVLVAGRYDAQGNVIAHDANLEL